MTDTAPDSGIEAMLDAMLGAYSLAEKLIEERDDARRRHDEQAISISRLTDERDEMARKRNEANNEYHRAVEAAQREIDRRDANLAELRAENELAEQNIAALAGSVKALESEKQRLQESALSPRMAEHLSHYVELHMHGEVAKEEILAKLRATGETE